MEKYNSDWNFDSPKSKINSFQQGKQNKEWQKNIHKLKGLIFLQQLNFLFIVFSILEGEATPTVLNNACHGEALYQQEHFILNQFNIKTASVYFT